METTKSIHNKEKLVAIELKLNSIKEEMTKLISPTNKNVLFNTDRLVEIATEIKKIETNKQRLEKESKVAK